MPLNGGIFPNFKVNIIHLKRYGEERKMVF
jgi:hypothetical protein